NAVAGNDNAVENIAGVILPGSGPDAEQGQVTGFGQNAGVTGIFLASNKVSSAAEAAISFATARGTVIAHGGDITIGATDTAGIASFSSVVQSATAQNDPTRLIQSVNDELIPNDYDVTTASGERALVSGDRVRLGATYAGCTTGLCGLPGAVYEYLPGAGVVLLGTADYSDPLVWNKLEAGTATLDQLYPGIGNITISKAKATGILVVMNDVRGVVKADLTNAAVTAFGVVSVQAAENAWLIANATTNVSAEGGSPIGFGFLGLLLGLNTSTKGFQVVTNLVLADADASVAGSTVSAASLVVAATNHSGIDATLHSTADTIGGSALIAALAFNLLGWKPQNVFANTLDAFLGLAPENETRAATAVATLTDAVVQVTGALTVSAVNAAILNATISNAASSVVSGLFNVAGGAKGAILTSNKVSSSAQALVSNDIITVGGAMTVTASDDAGIYANVKIVGSSVTTNSGAIDVISGAIASSVHADFVSSEIAGTLEFGDRVRIDAGYGDPDFTTSGDGLRPVTLTSAAHEVALHSTYGASHLTTASGIRLLSLGDVVTVDQGYLLGGAWGGAYRYIGPNARRDLGAQDFLDLALWRLVGGNGGSVYSYRPTITAGNSVSVDINSTDFSDPDLWQELAGAPGTVYEYLGTTRHGVDLDIENYTDLGWWRPVPETQLFPTFNITNSNSSAMGGTIVLNDVRSVVKAAITGSAITAASLTVRAVEQAVIRALADVTTTSSGGSSWDGQGSSTAISAVIATNRVLGSAAAVIEDSDLADDPATTTITEGITAGDLVVIAENLAQIDATNLVAASSGNFAMGLVLAFNTLGWNPSPTFFALIDAILGDPLISEAYNGENPIATLASITGTPLSVAGDVLVTALTDARINALVSNSATSAPAALFGASGTSVGMVVASNKVSATTRAFIAAEEPDVVVAPANRLRVDVGGKVSVRAENSATITADTAMYGEVSPTNDAGAGIINTFAGLLLDAYDYTSRSGTRNLAFGDTVRVADDYTFTGLQVDPDFDPAGAVFEWMGTDTLGLGAVLGDQDYSDFELWKQLTPTNIITDSFSYALLSEIGTALKKEGMTGGAKSFYGLIDDNDVRSSVTAWLRDVDLTAEAVIVQAFGLGSITASDVSVIVPWEGFGAVIVTNTVLADADAHILDSAVTTTGVPSLDDLSGDVLVEAQNAAAIDATAMSHIEAWTAISAVVAFNSIGWKPSNLLFNAVDALIGDPLISAAFNGEQPAGALAYLRNTTVVASGDITVTAVSASQLNAVAGNENVVEAALDLLFLGAQSTTTSTNAKTGKSESKTSGYGASGIAGGAILASNKVSSRAEAFIEFTPTQGLVKAAGAVTVHAEDAAGINAQSTVVQDVKTSNTLDGLVDIVEQFLVPGDYDYTTRSGTRWLTAGDTVRLGSAYAGCADGLCGDAGAVYSYLGSDGLLDLGTTDYAADPLSWYKLTGGITDPESWYPGIGNFTDSDARAVGILIVMNDLRSGVEAHVSNAYLRAAAVSVTALENAWLQADGLLTVSASGGSFYGSGTVLAVGGQVATNVVLAEAHAYIAAGDVEVTGDVTVIAKNTSGIDATILSSTSSGGNAVGVTLAFNTLGWKSQNVLFNAVDALLGDPLIADVLGGEQPSEAVAYIVNSHIVSTAGGVSVLADNAAQLNATLSNAAISQASALFGATGAAVGGMLASNKVSARAEAYIEHSDGYATAGATRQVIDLVPSTPVTLHSTYGLANHDAAAATTSQSVPASDALTVRLAAGYGAADFTAAGSGSRLVTLTQGTTVTVGADYGSTDLTAVSSGAP
ncbi:MAG: hypothetical protein WAL91_04355, partial [Propionicimonas sp.]